MLWLDYDFLLLSRSTWDRICHSSRLISTVYLTLASEACRLFRVYVAQISKIIVVLELEACHLFHVDLFLERHVLRLMPHQAHATLVDILLYTLEVVSVSTIVPPLRIFLFHLSQDVLVLFHPQLVKYKSEQSDLKCAEPQKQLSIAGVLARLWVSHALWAQEYLTHD